MRESYVITSLFKLAEQIALKQMKTLAAKGMQNSKRLALKKIEFRCYFGHKL